MDMTEHFHDCTGPDATCPCGYRFSVPRFSLSIEVFDGRQELVENHFNCSSLATVIDALREAADRIEHFVDAPHHLRRWTR